MKFGVDLIGPGVELAFVGERKRGVHRTLSQRHVYRRRDVAALAVLVLDVVAAAGAASVGAACHRKLGFRLRVDSRITAASDAVACHHKLPASSG